MGAEDLTGAEITIRCLQEEGVKHIFGYPGDSDVMISSWTTYHGDYQSLATVYILFPIENGLAYYNRRQILGYDRWFEPGLLSWKADQYFYGLPTDLGEQLRSCLYEYDN